MLHHRQQLEAGLVYTPQGKDFPAHHAAIAPPTDMSIQEWRAQHPAAQSNAAPIYPAYYMQGPPDPQLPHPGYTTQALLSDNEGVNAPQAPPRGHHANPVPPFLFAGAPMKAASDPGTSSLDLHPIDKGRVVDLTVDLPVVEGPSSGSEDPVGILKNFEKTEPATITWRDISFTVTQKIKNAQDKKVLEHTQILNNLSGVVKPGEMLAICGPSGGGKTTLLDAIAGRLDGSRRGRKLEGQVCINARLRDANFKKIASYVQQEHALQTPFTVKQTMGYAADLLLPHSRYNAAKRKEMIEEVIHVLGLDSCQNTIVGDVFRKGLSGGQLRRLSIAVELIGNPGILLLDEPTSGLDSTAAENIMQYLTRLAKSGRTVICTIHQPPTEVWNSFDKFCLLSKGKCLYFGPAIESNAYFNALGHPCPNFSNPADHFLRLANTDFDGHADIEELARVYPESAQGIALREGLDSAGCGCDESAYEAFVQMPFHNNAWSQFTTLSRRALMNNVRNPGIFLVRLIMYTGLGAVIGFMFWDIGSRLETQDIMARSAMLFFVSAFLVFMSVAVLPFFILERTVFLRERANGWYNVAAYVLATFLMSLPGLAIIALVSTLLVVLPTGINGFGVFLLDLFLSLVAGEAFMSVIGSIVPHYIIGIAMGAATYGFFMLCEGFMLTKTDIPPWFIWGHHIGFHTYSFRAFIVNEFQDLPVLNSPQFQNGYEVIAYYDMQDQPIWKDLLIVGSYSVGLIVIYGLILQVFHTGKR